MTRPDPIAATKRASVIRAYVENVGHEPRELPHDDPLRWQWEYRGTPEEIERLRRELFDEPPQPPVEQASLL